MADGHKEQREKKRINIVPALPCHSIQRKDDGFDNRLRLLHLASVQTLLTELRREVPMCFKATHTHTHTRS